MANNVTDLGKVGITPKGNWSSSTTYERLDVVTYEGSSYVSLVDSNTNFNPSTSTGKWQLMAQHGEFTEQQLEEFKAAVVAESKEEMDDYTDAKKTILDSYTNTKKGELDTYESAKETELNTYTGTKKTELDTYIGGLKTDFNDNASAKTTAFNTNASDKTTAFDNNASSKTTAFDNNTTEKTTAFDEHVDEKIDEFDEHTEEMQQEIDELSANMPWNTTEQATEIQVTDAAKYSKNKLELFGNTSQDSLPTGYTALDYIESTGTQYIDTGRLSTPNTKFEMDYISTKQVGDAYQNLLGSQNGTTRRAYVLIGSPNAIQTLFPYSTDYRALYMQNDGTFSSSSSEKDVHFNAEEKYKIIFDIPNKSLTVGQYTSASSNTDELLDSGHNILILARNDNTTPTSNFATGKLYRFKWYENNVLTMDFVPCKNSNNEIGLYDLVSQTFFGNAGTGDFVAGNEVTIPNPDYPQPIHVVTGNNSIGVQGRNLIPGEVFEFCTITNTGEKTQDSTRICTDFIELDPAKQYFLSASINYGFSGIAFYDNTYTYISRLYWGNSKRHTIATTDIPNNTKYVKVFGQMTNDVIASTSEFEKNEWYLEEGDSNNTKYVPYYHADYPINLGLLELCKIGNYQDKFVKDNGVWKIPNKIVKIDSYNGETITTPYISTTGGLDIGATIYYVGNVEYTITDETLTAQLDEIYEHLTLVKGTNNITVTAEDLAPYMKLSYMQDLKSKLDNLDSRLSLLE